MYLSLIYYNKVSFIEIDFKKKDGLIVTGYNHFVHGMFFAFFVFYYSWYVITKRKKIKVLISDLQEKNFKFGTDFPNVSAKIRKFKLFGWRDIQRAFQTI